MAVHQSDLAARTTTRRATGEGLAHEVGVPSFGDLAWVNAPDHAAGYLCQKVHVMPHPR